jgi:hypothetical protein
MVDLYCERLGPGLWSEPLNATTNVAFFVSAVAVWKAGRKREEQSSGIRLLVTLIIVIGIGSGLFHTFATTWAVVLDVASIVVFQLALLWLYCRKILEIQSMLLGGLLLVFLATTLYGREFPEVIGGSLPYLPTAVVIVVLGFNHLRLQLVDAFVLLIASGVFVVSLVLRSIDSVVCAAVPFGTHFLWHILNAIVLYLASRAYVRNLPVAQRMA